MTTAHMKEEFIAIAQNQSGMQHDNKSQKSQ